MKDVSTGSWYLRSEFTNEITQALGRAIERVVYDGADPKASLDQAQAEAERVLKQVAAGTEARRRPRLPVRVAVGARCTRTASRRMQQELTCLRPFMRRPMMLRRRPLHMGMAAKQAAFGYAILLPTLVDPLRLPLPADDRGVRHQPSRKYDLIHPPQVRRASPTSSTLLHDPLFLNSVADLADLRGVQRAAGAGRCRSASRCCSTAACS